MANNRFTEEAITAEERAFLLGLLDYQDYVNLFMRGVWFCTKKGTYNNEIEEKFSLLDRILFDALSVEFGKTDYEGTDKIRMIEDILGKLARIQKRFASGV